MHDFGSPTCGYQPPPPTPKSIDTDRETLAALEHEQWMAWAIELGARENLSEECRARWRSLLVPYSQLTDEQKNKDREWADRVMGTVSRLRCSAPEQPLYLDRRALADIPSGWFWPGAGQVKAMARELLRLQEQHGPAGGAGAAAPTSREVDDTLDAAGVPHIDERGSLTTAQRVRWLAEQRDKWRASSMRRSTLSDGFVPLQRDEHGRVGVPKRAYDRGAVADRVRQIASGLTYNDSSAEGCAKHWLYELEARIRSGSVTCPVDVATKPLHAEIAALRSKWDSTDAAHRELDAAGAPKEVCNAMGQNSLATVPERVRWLACESKRQSARADATEKQAAAIGRLTDFVSTHPEAPKGTVGQSSVDIAIRWIGDLIGERVGLRAAAKTSAEEAAAAKMANAIADDVESTMLGDVVDRLKCALVDCAAAIGFDAPVQPSVDFLCEVPKEVAAVVKRLRAAWTPSGKDYDRSIHTNPSADAWADFFVATYPGLADKHDVMRGWFANAMMAMHDSIKGPANGEMAEAMLKAKPAEPERPKGEPVTIEKLAEKAAKMAAAIGSGMPNEDIPRRENLRSVLDAVQVLHELPAAMRPGS